MVHGRTENRSDIRAMARGLVRAEPGESTKELYYQFANAQYVLECLLEDTED